MDIPPGSLLRKVLPFDETTSSTDQSHVSATLNAVGGMGGEGNEGVLLDLRAAAMEVRRTIRVKMADEADLRQVRGGCMYLCLLCVFVCTIYM